MEYGKMIRDWRNERGWTQRILSEKLGCTDSYVTHIESEMKLPSLDICMALAQVFQLTPAEQQYFLEAVEKSRGQRAAGRIQVRGSAVRGALQRRGLGMTAPVQTSGATEADTDSIEGGDIEADDIVRDLAADPELRVAYRNLKLALADPGMRQAVLNMLQAIAQRSEPL